MSLKNKRILITAGPTLVPVDNVRVISNIATGRTGILLAENLVRQGAKVTLLLAGADSCCLGNRIRLIRFIFFDELKNKIIKELKNKRYDIVIHSAAVSDYKPAKVYTKKVKSGIRNWRLNLVPTGKVIDLIKKINCSLFVVGFKFEPLITKNALIKTTRKLIRRANLDLAVANGIYRNRYLAYIVNRDKIYGPVFNKEHLTEKLINIIGDKYGRTEDLRPA